MQAPISYSRFRNIALTINAGNTDAIHTIYKPGLIQLTDRFQATTFHGVIKSLRLKVFIKSIPEIVFDDNLIVEMTSIQRSTYFRDLEWSKPHKRIKLFLNSSGQNIEIDDISLVNRNPFYWVASLDRITGIENGNFGIDPNSSLRCQIIDDGYGKLQNFDRVDVFGTVEESAYYQTESQPEITNCTSYNWAVSTSSTLLLPSNPNRKYVAITNYSNTDVFINYGIAVLNQGICLKANGGTIQVDNLIRLPICAIAESPASLSGMECE